MAAHAVDDRSHPDGWLDVDRGLFAVRAPVAPAERAFGWLVVFPAIVGRAVARYLTRPESTSWGGDILRFAGAFIVIGAVLGLCVFVWGGGKLGRPGEMVAYILSLWRSNGPAALSGFLAFVATDMFIARPDRPGRPKDLVIRKRWAIRRQFGAPWWLQCHSAARRYVSCCGEQQFPYIRLSKSAFAASPPPCRTSKRRPRNKQGCGALGRSLPRGDTPCRLESGR